MFKLIIEKIKRKSHKKKQKSEPSSPEDKKLIPESEHSEADEEAIRVQLWRDAQVSRAIRRYNPIIGFFRYKNYCYRLIS